GIRRSAGDEQTVRILPHTVPLVGGKVNRTRDRYAIVTRVNWAGSQETKNPGPCDPGFSESLRLHPLCRGLGETVRILGGERGAAVAALGQRGRLLARARGRCGRIVHLARVDDVADLRAVERLELEQRLGDGFEFVAIFGKDLLGAIVGVVAQLAD